MIARDHQHRYLLAPRCQLGEHDVELARREHCARVPEVAEARDACAPRPRLGRHLAKQPQAHGQCVLSHVQVREDHPLPRQPVHHIVRHAVDQLAAAVGGVAASALNGKPTRGAD
eukprot:842529-Prymnesium_polylepis.2